MTWEDIIDLEKQKDYYKKLKEEIDKRYETSKVFPEKKNIFKAFSLSKIEDLMVNDIVESEKAFIERLRELMN